MYVAVTVLGGLRSAAVAATLPGPRMASPVMGPVAAAVSCLFSILITDGDQGPSKSRIQPERAVTSYRM
jgi:hypothetical protein